MQTHILIRYAEIGLKGKNRALFESQLIKNIKAAAAKHGNENETAAPVRVKRLYGRILLTATTPLPLLACLPGIANFSPAQECTLDPVAMTDALLALQPLGPNETFAVRCQRIDKTIGLRSNEVEKSVGALIVERTKAGVNLDNPQHTLGVELLGGKAYVFTKRIAGIGGLPVGTAGKVLAFIKNNDLSTWLAAFLMMKRGCALVIISDTPPDERKLAILQSGSPAPIRIRLISPDAAITEMVREEKAKAVVTGWPVPSVLKNGTGTPPMILCPTSGLSAKQIKEQWNELEHRCM